MTTKHRSRARLIVRLLIFLAMIVAGLALLNSSPASAWCSPQPTGSPLESYGQEFYRGATCDGDNYYLGQVRDHPYVADGECAHVRLQAPSGAVFTQAYSCTGNWVGYSVSNARAYDPKVCEGPGWKCSYGSYRGA